MKRVQIVANPSAGNYNPKVIDRLFQGFVHAGALPKTTPAGPGQPALVIDDETEILCVVGGDGSIRHTAQVAMATHPHTKIAAWPGGTVNLFQREHQRPTEEKAFAAAVISAEPIAHYAVSANDTVCLGCASIGPDAIAVANVSEKLKAMIGRVAYGVSLLNVVFKWPRPALIVDTPNGQFHGEAVYIAVGRYFAGPWSFAPTADRREKAFHLLVFKRCKRRDYLRFLLMLVRGKDMQTNPNFTILKLSECRITSLVSCASQLDGDVGPALPLAFKTIDQPLTIV